MPQTLQLPTSSAQFTPTPPVFTFIVTLFHRRTEDEQGFTIETLTDSFCAVLNEINNQRVARRLFGYEILEVLDRTPPF